MPIEELMEKLPKETQKTIRDATKLGMKMHRELKESERKRMQKARDDFLKSMRDRINVYILVGDVDAFNRLLAQVEILGDYELVTILREKGLQKDFEALLDRAGELGKAALDC